MKHETAQAILKKLAPKEPTFNSEVELSQLDLTKALNWYSIHAEPKDREKYVLAYLKVKSVSENKMREVTPTLAHICRIVFCGGKLSDEDFQKFDKKMKSIFDQTPSIQTSNKNVISIQERIQETVSNSIGNLEGSIDDFILSKYKSKFSFKALFMEWNIKPIHATKILDWAKAKRKEFSDVMSSKEEDVLEGYSNFSKRDLKKIVSLIDEMIVDALNLIDEKKVTRKPRKRKPKTAEQIVSKVNYLKEDKIYGFSSIEPSKIIGTNQLWVFNVKLRKIGVYFAQDAAGLSIKGSTILNFDDKLSVAKTVRKPKETVMEILKSGKAAIKTTFAKLNSKQTSLTGRINSDTILLRII